MSTAGWLVAAIVATSTVVVCTWMFLRTRRERRRLTPRIENLTRQVELQQASLEALVESGDSVTDALGTMMMLSNSYSATITSDAERREALILIARACREALEAQSQSRLSSQAHR